jgi:hypothetical protein
VERLAPGYLLDDQPAGLSSPLYLVLAAVLLAICAVGLYVYLRSEQRFAHDPMLRRLVRRLAGLVAVWSGAALAATIFGWFGVPFLSKRLWLALALAGLVLTLAWSLYYRRYRYPAARYRYLERERRQRSLPRPRRGRRRRGRQR